MTCESELWDDVSRGHEVLRWPRGRPPPLLVLRPIAGAPPSELGWLCCLSASIQAAVVQFEVSLPRPPRWSTFREPAILTGPWLPPPASDWHHCTAKDIKQDNNSFSFLPIPSRPTRQAHIVHIHMWLHDKKVNTSLYSLTGIRKGRDLGIWLRLVLFVTAM